MDKGKYEIIEGLPAAKEIVKLRNLVGWGDVDQESMEKGLASSLYAVFVLLDEEVIGTARIVGDGSTCFYIQDVIVKPGHQKMGIGTAVMKRIMNYISKNACSGAIVGLMAAKGKEDFYEKFGFWKRPNENFGHGMIQFWDKK
ncbi:MAG TPA: GNAT family N-acetyltransferase [Methylomusa anaerophila]|uniref:Acetyltransferase (GNAT) family protein n=1 Tax=Methylomusa anaerophila TaxID=1930071 RepID=A0A348AEI8_9FIRM|nr:GNAT family N-acetyltransferase [Methylomusa anaerophila]BBB89486.1 acetyltransferase (GNAT) family protein [Methylomusa anaerophila]HML89717.1 GNAT family N-acetyltransferase [Methylomusa anaerophila]